METVKKQSLPAPHIALLAAQVMFGSAPVIGKVALQSFSSNAIVGFRVGGAAVAFVLLQKLFGSMRLERKQDYWWLALYSLLGIVFNQLLFFNGLRMTTATNTALLAVLIPIFAAAVSAVFGFDRLTRRKIAGIAVAAGGVIYLIDPAHADFSQGTLAGDLTIILNCLFYATYIAISKDVIARNGALKSLAWLFLFGAFVCVPLGAFALRDFDFAQVPATAWQAVGYLVLFQTILGYFLNAWALARVSPAIVAVYIYLQPLIGFALAVAFLGEHFTWRAVVAGLLIFVGVFLTTRGKTTDARQHDTLH